MTKYKLPEVFKIGFDHANWQDRNMQHYRTLFFALEGGLIAFLDKIPSSMVINPRLIFCTLGIFFGGIWIYICNHRGKIVEHYRNRMRDEILKLGKSERDFLYPMLDEKEHKPVRNIFNIYVPLMFIVLWLILIYVLIK